MCVPSTITISGGKQHDHVISRTDHWPASRQSVTAVTSTWSDGSRGPLGICYPSGAFSASYVDEYNKKHLGESYMFESQTQTHFMCGATFQVLLHGLISPAFAAKRKSLKVDKGTKGMLLADGWTGFHSHRTGLDHARRAWSLANSVELPSEQVLELDRKPPSLSMLYLNA